MRVDRDSQATQAPHESILEFGASIGCGSDTVGMMTAASMKSLRVLQGCIDDKQLSVVVTTGLENARRAGDPADYVTVSETGAVGGPEAGTINLAIVVDFDMPAAAMVEMLTVATEAKAAALQDLGVVSPVSGRLATGTGTDAVALAAPAQSSGTLYAGKHTQLGELLATLVIRAISDSVGGWSGT